MVLYRARGAHDPSGTPPLVIWHRLRIRCIVPEAFMSLIVSWVKRQLLTPAPRFEGSLLVQTIEDKLVTHKSGLAGCDDSASNT